jgi:hypothetical protein
MAKSGDKNDIEAPDWGRGFKSRLSDHFDQILALSPWKVPIFLRLGRKKVHFL